MLFIPTTHCQDFDYSFKETYNVRLPAKLRVSSFDGNIDVVPGRGNEIQVYYRVTKNGRLLKVNRADLDEELVVRVEHDDDQLEISVKNKYEDRIFNWRNHMNVSFRVVVPGETSCDLRTSDGDISLMGLTSEQQCRTSDGNIRISEVRGSIRGSTSDGNINLKQVRGSVELKTSDGDIVLDNVIGDVQSTTSDGNIRITRVKGNTYAKTSDGDVSFEDLSGSLSASTSDGNIRGEIVDLQKQLNARTSDGNIDITMPDRLGMNLSIKGESLHVPLKNFSGTTDKHHIEGRVNGGGIAVTLVTSDGHITLAYK